MAVRVSAGTFVGPVLHTDESSDPEVDGDNADWDTGGTTPPPPAPATTAWVPVMASNPIIVTTTGEAVYTPLVTSSGEAVMIEAVVA